MPELVPQQPQPPQPVAAFDFAHHAALEAQQARMRDEERNRDARHAVRRKPFFGEPDVRLEANAAPFERFAEAQRFRVHWAVYEREAEIAEAHAKQRRVVESFPSMEMRASARELMRLSSQRLGGLSLS